MSSAGVSSACGASTLAGALLAWTLANAETLARPITALLGGEAGTTSPVTVPAAGASEAREPIWARGREELASLPELVSDLQFEPGSDGLEEPLREPLERVSEILFRYPHVDVDIAVTSNEYEGEANDLLLGRARAQAIVDHLVSLGLERDRFEIDVAVGDGLPSGEHRVRVRAEDHPR